MMSQIGCITLPGDILHKLQAGNPLSDEEQRMYENHPKVGSRLIRKIPRLENVADMIKYQLRSFDCRDSIEGQEGDVLFGAEILKVTIEYDLLRQQDFGHLQAIRHMRQQTNKYNIEILDLLEKHKPAEVQSTVKSLSFKDIIPGMIAVEDVFAKNGTMLIPKDQEITWSVIQSLSNFSKHIGIVEPIRVLVADPVVAEE